VKSENEDRDEGHRISSKDRVRDALRALRVPNAAANGTSSAMRPEEGDLAVMRMPEPRRDEREDEAIDSSSPRNGNPHASGSAAPLKSVTARSPAPRLPIAAHGLAVAWAPWRDRAAVCEVVRGARAAGVLSAPLGSTRAGARE
jgi:hypothetical protein